MTVALRDFLMRMDGMDANIDGAPNAKQWAKITEWIEALKTATVSAPVAGPMAAGPEPAAGVTKPVIAADAAALLKQVEDMKRRGMAAAGTAGGGQAMSAGV